MFESFKVFIEDLNSEKIQISNPKINKILKNYTFLHVVEIIFINQNEKMYDDFKNSEFIVIDYYHTKNGNEKVFFVVFKKTIIIIKQSSISFLQQFLSSKEQVNISFLSDSKNIFDSNIDIKYNDFQDEKKYVDELSYFEEEFSLKGNKNNLFWNKIKKCICFYLIKQSYLKSDQERCITFIDKINKQPQIFKEDEYIKLNRIGVGSKFYVYLIYHIEKEELFVLKIPIDEFSDESQRLFQREKNNYSELAHLLLPKYYGYVQNKNYLVIEFINGKTLLNIKNLEFEEKISIIYELIIVIAYLHDKGFIYRDLKPNNVMIDKNKTAVLIDFDLLVPFNYSNSNNNATNDFPSIFVAPEVLSGNYSYKCDVYSLGKMIYYIFNNIDNPKKLKVKDIFQKYSIIHKIYNDCTKLNPNERPSVSDLIRDINDNFHSLIPKEIQDFFLYTYGFTKTEIQNPIKNHIYFRITDDDGIKYEGNFENKPELMKLLIDAAFKNDSNTFYNLGQIYEDGKETKKDMKMAMYFYERAANLNDPIAQTKIGFIYYQGIYVLRNINKAMHYFYLAAKQNQPEAAYNLGIIFLDQKFVPRDIEKAMAYFKQAADLNYKEAQTTMGTIYISDSYVPKDIDKAVEYFTKAANQNFEVAQYHLGYIFLYEKYYPHDINKSIYYFTLSANQGYADSQYELGIIYYDGMYVARDFNKAIEYLEKASKQNHIKSLHILGIINLQYDIRRSINYLTIAANLNNIHSQYMLGLIYCNNESNTYDINKAIYYLKLAADKNHVESQFVLGCLFYENKFIPNNIEKCIQYLKKAADNNYPIAQFNLAILYYEGFYVIRDIKKSIYFFSLAQKNGMSDASLNLGLIFLNGQYVDQDIPKAIEYLKIASNQNNPKAQYNLAILYSEGNHVKRDIVTALQYLTNAAENGFPQAQCTLGLFYEIGNDVKQDIKKCIYYYQLAAYKNVPQAQYKLGCFNIEGRYVKQDINKGFNLLLQSSQNGFIPASFMIGFLYHEGKYIEQDIRKSICYYKIASSFNYQFALNNLGIIYKNGFNGFVEKNIGYAIVYFNDAINFKNDILSMYNLANIYLYEMNQTNDTLKPIELLIQSMKNKFQPSFELILIALIKQYGLDFDKYKQILTKFTENPDQMINRMIDIIFSQDLNEDSKFQISYEYYKNIDFLYNYKKEIIPSDSITMKKQFTKSTQNSKRKNITNDFYEGFAI